MMSELRFERMSIKITANTMKKITKKKERKHLHGNMIIHHSVEVG